MKKKIEAILNRQLNIEYDAANKYLGMSIYAETMGLSGIGDFFRGQFKEEQEHMMKYYHYILDHAGLPIIQDLKKPKHTYKSIPELFKTALKMEEKVLTTSEEVYFLAQDLKDATTAHFIQGYLKIQSDEIKTMNGILDKINHLGHDSRALYFLDKELAELADTDND